MAAETRIKLPSPGVIELVFFIVCRFIAGFHPLPHIDVARRAGADAAARVIEIDMSPLGDVEDAERQTIVPRPALRRVDLDDDVERQKRDPYFCVGGFDLSSVRCTDLRRPFFVPLTALYGLAAASTRRTMLGPRGRGG